jgi:hypothetical protein
MLSFLSMKKTLILLPLLALLGAGCFSSATPTPVGSDNQVKMPPKPEIHYAGCTPKALTVDGLTAGASVSLPLNVKVNVNNGAQPNCRWTVFEGQAASMRLFDGAGAVVGTGRLTTTNPDWMTDKAVDYTGQIPAVALVTGEATLVITEENPRGDGDPQEVSIPLTIVPAPAK